MRVVLATGNPGKLRELQELLAPLQFQVLPQSQFTDSFLVLALRTPLDDAERLIPQVRAIVREMDPSVPMYADAAR